MWKIVVTLLAVVLFGYFAVDGLWPVHISAFGYEFTCSALIIILAALMVFYILFAIRRPMAWFKEYQAHRKLRVANETGAFWQLVLITIMDQNNEHINDIFKRKKNFVEKGSLEDLLIESIFRPTPENLEKLCAFDRTKLAGLHGLIGLARAKGDFATEHRLLENARTAYPHVSWVLHDLMNIQIMRDEFEQANKTLAQLYKNDWISKDEYYDKRAEIAYELKDFKEAYYFMPDNTLYALAWAKAAPKKAEGILEKAWEERPDMDVYMAYKKCLTGLKDSKKMAAVEKFAGRNREGGLYLIAQADAAMDNGLWGIAKEDLDTYIAQYPLTRTVAEMMERIERDGYKHADAAKEWSEKAARM